MGIKVAIISPGLGLGGAENSLIKFIRIIYPKTVCLELIILSDSDSYMESRLPDGVAVHVIHSNSSANPITWLKVGRRIHKLKPDVVIGWSTYANFVAMVTSVLSRNSKLIVSERNYIPQMYSSAVVSVFRRKIVLELIKMLYSRADVVTANSSMNLGFLKKFVGPGPQYKLLPNVYDSDATDLSADNTTNPAADSSDNPRILAVGRLVHQKGFDVLLQAFSEVHRQRPNWKLHIVGDGPERESLLKLTESLGLIDVVVWLGRDPNPFPYYRWSDIVVVPSRFEGFPNVPLEAMGHGKAVICSNCKSGPAELLNNGQFGVLTPVGDSVALAAAIIKLGSSPDQIHDLGAKARNHIRSKYGLDAVKLAYEDVLGLNR